MGSEANERIWVFAQSFGHGPGALAYKIVPQLRKLVSTKTKAPFLLEFFGEGHSLDFNTSPPWDVVHTCDISAPDGLAQFIELYGKLKPSLLITICGEQAAAAACAVNLPVVIIDPILWWWPSIPYIWQTVSLVIAPNFIGVEERMKRERLQNVLIVPPLAHVEEMCQARRGTLINLGGLQNPFVPLSQLVTYAELMLSAVKSIIEERGEADDLPLRCLVSAKVRDGLTGFDWVESTTPSRARLLLKQSKTAFLTSGLGNIVDAAECGGRIIFLPPTNASQGLQPQLLMEKLDCFIAQVDWHHFVPDIEAVDYTVPDDECFRCIEYRQAHLAASYTAQKSLRDCIRNMIGGSDKTSISLGKIFDKFGKDDGSLIMRAIAGADLGCEVT